jgi:UDP-N-acetylmuramoylalanine--D-glutamate ligase
MAKAMSRGGEYCDLYFQRAHRNYLGLEDHAVNRGYSRRDVGVGVRVVKGLETGYAYTESLDLASMLMVLCEFPGLPHRMEFVRQFGGVDYVNDSKATNVAAAVAAVDSVDGELVLVAGGDGKGGDFRPLADALENKLRAAVLIGKDAQAISDALDTVHPVYFADDMNEAVDTASAYAEPGDTVLLAPACASLDQYRNYMARGDAFAEAVMGLRE